MTKQELKKHTKVWCWWKSRSLYFTGRVINGKYEFVDICDAITMVTEEELADLEVR
ncbi:MAG: hypothetical protein LUD19_03335 [Clostridia bacterium]|nr:hypothetical protein [Clostridia bacterium]